MDELQVVKYPCPAVITMKFEVNSSHLFRYASELDPTDEQKVRNYLKVIMFVIIIVFSFRKPREDTWRASYSSPSRLETRESSSPP